MKKLTLLSILLATIAGTITAQTEETIDISGNNTSSSYVSYNKTISLPASKTVNVKMARYCYFSSAISGSGLLNLYPGGERSYTLYDDDGVSNDYRNGGYRKTEITMSGSPDRTVTVTFRSEGLYRDFTERVTVEMICRERSPLRVALGNQVLERFLNRSRFESAGIGWYYSQTNRAVLIRYPNPDGEYTLTVSFEPQDLIGM